MKRTLFILLTLIATNGFSQKTVSAYIEVRGVVDILGNIYLDNLIRPKKLSVTDSLIDYAAIYKTILTLKDPVKVINELAGEGWSLVTVTQVQSDRQGRPSSPFMLYYFRRDFKNGDDQ